MSIKPYNYNNPQKSSSFSGGGKIKPFQYDESAGSPILAPEEKKESTFSKIISAPKRAIQFAGDKLAETKYMQDVGVGLNEMEKETGQESGAEKLLKTSSSLIGFSGPENLPLGVGQIVQEFKNAKDPNNTETFDITLEDYLTGVVETSKAFVKTPVTAVSNFAGVPVKFNLPVLGEVTNRQFNTAERIRNGEDPTLVTAEEGIGSIFDTLFIVGMMAEVASPRTVTVAKGKLPKDSPVTVKAPLRSFRPYTEPIFKQPVTPVTKEAMTGIIEKYGLNAGAKYNPELPTYFQMTGKSGSNIKVEVVQIRPSYLNSALNYFKKNPVGYNTTQTELLTSGRDWDRAIESGDIPVNKIYNPNGTLTPEAVKHTVGDLSGKLNDFKAGLGDKFAKGVDLKNPTPTNLESQASTILAKSVVGQNIESIKLPVLTPEQVNAIPPEAKTSIITKEVNLDEVKKTLATKQEAPTVSEDGNLAITDTPPEVVPFSETPLSKPKSETSVEITDLEVGQVIEAVNENLAVTGKILDILEDSVVLKTAGGDKATFKESNFNFEPTTKKLPVETIQVPGIGEVKAIEKPQVTATPKSEKIEKTPIKKDNLNTPEGVAKDLIRGYVERGDSIADIKNGGMGSSSPDGYSAMIGGYLNGKKVTNDFIIVHRDGSGKVIDRIVSLKKMFAEIKAEKVSEEIAKKNGSLFDAPTQKEKVAEVLKSEPKTIKQIAEETKIKEPNIRRILGVGAKEGTFERIDKGVYILSKDGQDLAYIHTGDAVSTLPKLVADGLKADMVFLDIPYDTPAVKGGNRGANYDLLSLEGFGKILDSVKKLTRGENTPVIHMFSNAPSGMKKMVKYNELFIEKGFKPVGRGEYQKTYANGDPVGFPSRNGFIITEPEGIIVFTQSGELDKDLSSLNFTLVRPKGYQTEKPEEMLKAMVEMTTNEGDIVLDPFAGSGSTGSASIKAGRKAVLIEKNKTVVEEIIRPRIKDAIKQADVSKEIVKPKEVSDDQAIEEYMNKKRTKFRAKDQDKALALIVPKSEALTSKFLEHSDIKGKEIASYTYLSNLNKSTSFGLKAEEREIVQNVLDTLYKNETKINMADFKRAVLGDMLKLDVIKSDTYATYGADNVGLGNADARTYILNSDFEHGKTGHFSNDFRKELMVKDLEIKEIPVQAQNPTAKFAVVKKDVVLTEENVAENTLTVASSKEEAQKWIDNHTIKNDNPNRTVEENGMTVVDVNKKGLFGHFRTFDELGVSHIAEIQSDVFQSDKLQSRESKIADIEKEIVDIIEKQKENKEQLALVKEQNPKETSPYLEERIKTFDDRRIFLANELIKLQDEAKTSGPEKAFMGYKGIWQERMIREAIHIKAQEGFKTLRFPTPRTIAVIEGYTGGDGEYMPYEVTSAQDSDELTYGDTIDYGGEEMTVIDADSDSITVAKSDGVRHFNADDAMEEDIQGRWDEVVYEFEKGSLFKDFGEITTPAKAQEVLDNIQVYNQEKQFNSKARDIEREKEYLQNKLTNEQNKNGLQDRLDKAQTQLDTYLKFKKLVEEGVIKKEGMNAENMSDLSFKDKLEEKYGIDHGYWNYINDVFQRSERAQHYGSPQSMIDEVVAKTINPIKEYSEQVRDLQHEVNLAKNNTDDKISDIKKRIAVPKAEIAKLPKNLQKDLKDPTLTHEYSLDYGAEKILEQMAEKDPEETFNLEDFREDYIQEASENYDADFEGMYGKGMVFYEDKGGYGQEVWVTENDPETFNQPNGYDQTSSIEDFSIDNFDGEQKTVLQFYEKQVNKYLAKTRKDNLELITDDNGYEWLETQVTARDLEAPTAYRLKDDLAKVGIKVTDAQEQEIFALNEKIFGDDNVKIMGQILADNEALGSYQDGIIKILDGQANPKDTYYHEAVHKYLDVFTDRAEYIQILKEAQVKYGIKDLAVVEEKLAEDFIRYAKDRESAGIWDSLKAWFDKILSRIRKYLGNSKTIEEFYNDILAGKAKRAETPLKKSISDEIIKPKETPKAKIVRQIDTITYKKLDEISQKIGSESITRDALEKLGVEIDIAEEWIQHLPGKAMLPYISRREGQFEDFAYPEKASTPRQAEKIRQRNAKVMKVAESAFEGTKYSDGFDDVDTIRDAIDEYTTLRDKLKALKKDATEKRKELSAIRKGEYLMQLTKGDRRRAFSTLKDAFLLSDTELAKLRGGRDIMSMTREEFDNFMFRAQAEAQQIMELSEARTQLLGTIFAKELKKWENVADAMKLPNINEMSMDELKQLDEVLSQYQDGDEFLTTRQLETIDRTELTGLRTVREVLNHLAKKTGVTPEFAGVSKPHTWMYDTQLQRQDPFNKLLVDKYNVSYLKASEKAINVTNENDKLVKKARKSRPAPILQKLIPTDKNIRNWLETEPEERYKLEASMTPEEIDVAKFQDKYYREVYDWMTKKELEKNFTSRFEDKYYPHIRRGFLEAWKEEGFIKAFGEATKQFKQDEAVMTILNEKTGDILPYQKWVKFEQFRSGDLIPSENVALSFKTYVHAIEKAKQFDEFIPEMMIYAHTLSPRLTTERGVEMDDRIQNFFKKWINSKKGRVEKQIITPGSSGDWALRTAVALLRVRDLGFNLATQIASVVGEQSGNIIMLRTKYPLGVARLATKQGRAIVAKYENFIGKSIYERFTEPSADVGDKLMTGLMGLFGESSRIANKTFLLSNMTKAEFNAGEISVERLGELRNKMGRYRVVDGAESVIGKSVEMNVVKQHKKWAIPMIVTTAHNFKVLAQRVKKGDWKGVKSEEGAETLTAILLTAIIALGSYGYYKSLEKKGSKRNFAEDLAFKATRESLSLISALDPRFIVSFTQPRLASFLIDMSDALMSIAKLEEYKTGDREGDLKGVQQLKRIITPVVVSQFTPESKSKAEVEVERLNKLTPAQIKYEMKKYEKTDPSLFRKVNNMMEDIKLGITEEDKTIRSMGVENYERAEYVYNSIKGKTLGEQNFYLVGLKKKKVISDEVMSQIKKLQAGQKLK